MPSGTPVKKLADRRQSPRKRARPDTIDSANPVRNDSDPPAWNFQPFYDLVAGVREDLGAENLRRCSETLVSICRSVLQSGEESLAGINAFADKNDAFIGMIKTVVQGELWFAQTYINQMNT